MPSSIGSGAVYGIGIYGTSQYGVASVTVFVDGVSATAILNSTLQISADATHAVCGLCADELDGFVGNVSVSAEAIVVPTGAEATGTIGTVTQKSNNTIPIGGVVGTAEAGTLSLETNNYIDVTGFVATGFVGSVNVVAKATATVTGVFGTTAVGTVVILENEVIVSPTSIAVLIAGNLTISTTSFNFNAVASQYSRNRTAYVPRKPTDKERTVIIPAGQ